MYLRCTTGGKATSRLGPKIGPLGLSPKKGGDDTATPPVTGLKITGKLTTQNRQAQTEVVPSAPALVIEVLKEPRDRKKQKNIKHSGNIIFDEIVNTALGTALSVGCTVDGCQPHDIIEGINGGAVESSVSKEATRKESQAKTV